MSSIAPETVTQAESFSNLTPSSSRLMSVDALRGFDMLWIVGAGSIVSAIDNMSSNKVTTFFATQLKHVDWEGFRFYDLIFPLFLYIVGVSMVFSIDKAIASGGRVKAIWRVVYRSLLLFGLGVFHMGGLSKPWPDVALGGVLHRIAACYLLAALVYLFIRNTAGLIFVMGTLLVGYWGLLTFVPIPDLSLDKSTVTKIARQIESDSPPAIAASVKESITGSYEEGRNLTNYIDFLYLPGQKKQLYYINEGLLSTLPSVALTLYGIMTGLLLKNSSIAPKRKIWLMIGSGVVCILIGLLWSYQFPLIKRIWTSSFVLVASGLSGLLMAIFYWLIEVKAWRAWCQPFVWIGANALTIYILSPIVGFSKIAERLVGGEIQLFLDTQIAKGFGGLVIALVGLLLTFLLMRFLYKRNVLIRV
jgi:predicted acyltransferase